MPSKKNDIFLEYTPNEVLAIAFEVQDQQGFIRSGHGYTKYDDDLNPVEVNDNKTEVIDKIKAGYRSTGDKLATAKSEIERIQGKLMFKKLTQNLTSFEKSMLDALDSATPLTNYAVSIIASVPNSIEVDKQREKFEEKMATLKHHSEFYGNKGKRYDMTAEVLDAKYIQSREVYMITTLVNDRDILKFWWRDQPDLCDLIKGRKISMRGTVNRHEKNKYTGAKETMINRVKINSI